jgi:hypothetical protein
MGWAYGWCEPQASGEFLAPRWIFIGDAVSRRPEGLLLDPAQHAMLWEESSKAVGAFEL